MPTAIGLAWSLYYKDNSVIKELLKMPKLTDLGIDFNIAFPKNETFTALSDTYITYENF
jgi:hypothetical protein